MKRLVMATKQLVDHLEKCLDCQTEGLRSCRVHEQLIIEVNEYLADLEDS